LLIRIEIVKGCSYADLALVFGRALSLVLVLSLFHVI